MATASPMTTGEKTRVFPGNWSREDDHLIRSDYLFQRALAEL